MTPALDEKTRARRAWWKNEWLVMLLVLVVLHATGTLVHVQAFLQRGILATGVLSADVIPAAERRHLPPGIAFVDSTGETVRLDDLRGSVLFVNFWASWCAPCLAEMPSIERLHSTHADQIRFFLVTLDENPDQGFDHARQSGTSTPVYQPGSSLPATVYGGVLPTTLVVDARGLIAVRREGMAGYDSDGFRRALDTLVREGS